jgi:uncharacterized membrane protein YuzA (DUF378 family)
MVFIHITTQLEPQRSGNSTEKKMESLYIAGIVLAVVGAVNWGLVGLFKFDLVAAVTGSKFGEVNVVSRIVYVLVLVAGILAAASIPKIA